MCDYEILSLLNIVKVVTHGIFFLSADGFTVKRPKEEMSKNECRKKMSKENMPQSF